MKEFLNVFSNTAPSELRIEPRLDPLTHLAYCSVALPSLSDSANLQALRQQCLARNAELDVTGVLMHHEGLIVQWIEGPSSSVRQLWHSIQHDSRHHCVVKLLHADHEPVRMFVDWDMRPATREQLLDIVREAHQRSAQGQPTAWPPAIELLLRLIDPRGPMAYPKRPPGL